MKNEPRVGIIGCGAIAESHLEGYEKNGITPVAFADISKERADAFATKLGTARTYSSSEELLNSGIDAINICTPPNLHCQIALAALDRGIHVLCEKPLAGTLADSLAIEDAAAKSPAVFMMAFRHRFLPAHLKMRELIQSGDLGKIILFRNIFGGPMPSMKDKWFCQQAIAGGGVLMDTSTHGLDLFRFYCGEVAASSGHIAKAFEGTDVEDSGVVSLRAESGALGLVTSSWNMGTWKAVVEIETEFGALLYDYSNGAEIKVRRKDVKTTETIEVVESGGFSEQISHFLQTIADQSAPSPSAFDGRRAVEILDNLYLSESL